MSAPFAVDRRASPGLGGQWPFCCQAHNAAAAAAAAAAEATLQHGVRASATPGWSAAGLPDSDIPGCLLDGSSVLQELRLGALSQHACSCTRSDCIHLQHASHTRLDGFSVKSMLCQAVSQA